MFLKLDNTYLNQLIIVHTIKIVQDTSIFILKYALLCLQLLAKRIQDLRNFSNWHFLQFHFNLV